MPIVLIVDDELDAREMLAFRLENEGWRTLEAADGLSALEIAAREKPDLIILDLMMPGMSGEEVFAELKRNRDLETIPVIMLTAKGAPEDREAGLEMGADDYVTKPFSPGELVIRMERLLQRRGPGGTWDKAIEAGPFRLDLHSLTFSVNKVPVDLTGTEFRLLKILLENPGRDQGRSALLQRIWGYDERIQTRTLDTHVKRLREKLGTYAEAIETVRGIGYRFRPV